MCAERTSARHASLSYVNEYSVISVGESWAVRFEGGEVERLDDKMQAVTRAQELAKVNPPAEVVVLDREGRVEERSSYDEGP